MAHLQRMSLLGSLQRIRINLIITYIAQRNQFKILSSYNKPKIMKKFITLLIIVIGLISCSSDVDDKVRNSGFVGKWNWTGTHGGFAFHIHDTPASTGNTYQLNLMENNTFSILKNSVEVVNGKYEITMKESIYSGEIEKYITCDMGQNPQAIYFVTKGVITVQDDNKLSIDDNYHDGIGSGFERIE